MNLVELYNYQVLNPEHILERFLICFSYTKHAEPYKRTTMAATIQLRPMPVAFSEKLMKLFNEDKLMLRCGNHIFTIYKPCVISFMDSCESVTVVMSAQDIHRFGVKIDEPNI